LKQQIAVFWFRRDLRLYDNHALYRALCSGVPVIPVFIFEPEILGKLQWNNNARGFFIYNELFKLKSELERLGGSLRVFHSSTLDAFHVLMQEYDVKAVFANKDYEPYARQRDKEIAFYLKSANIHFNLFKDHVIFEEHEVVKDNGEPYTVFTPFSRRWKSILNPSLISSFSSEGLSNHYLKVKPFLFPELKSLGFEADLTEIPSSDLSESVIRNYGKTRDYPAVKGTSRLGIHLRFGTVSIREVVRSALEWSDVFLNELIWREFFFSILWHFPQVENKAFKSKFEFIGWRNNEKEFKRWCNGETGFPIVDAGMRELNETGFMHNRSRMITAGFLVKHLLIDWRWGEAYFAEKLLDYELAANNGNWQWAAGTGCDASPWFRIFNPDLQQKKFDPEGLYIMKWLPEWGSDKYPAPMVDHKKARERAIQVFKAAGIS
jgi:deoxyribodipyrimidine photo-lyase